MADDDTGGTWSSADSGGGGLSAGDIGGIASGLIGAAGSIFGGSTAASGYKKEAQLYDQAAELTGWNQTYHDESGQIQTILAVRQGMKTIGAQQAAVAAHGFQESGSNLYLLRDSQAQLGITKGMIGLQTAINEADDQEKGLAYKAQATAARTQAAAAQGGGILGALGGIAGKVLPMLGGLL